MAKKNGRAHLFRDVASSVHIKKNTAGTSNEISLSVLDGLKSQADDRLGEADPKVKLGDLSIFTVSSKKERRIASKEDRLPSLAKQPGLPSAAGEKKLPKKSPSPLRAETGSSPKRTSRKQRDRERALLDPEKEIKRRKKNRRFRRAAAIVVAAGCCCALVAGAVFFAIDVYEKNQTNLKLLSQAFDELEKADSLVLDMDNMVMQNEVDFSEEELAGVEQGIKDAGVHLSAACAFSEEAALSMGESEGKDAACQVSVSADARREMMQYAEALLHADWEAKAGVDAAQECWDKVVAADELMKEAASLVTDTTVENVSASQAKSEEALVVLSQAEESLARAQSECPSADFSALSALIAKKKEQNGYAIESDKAIYIQDKATAEAFNDAYNQADAEAVELVSSLPELPAQPILDRLDEQTSETRALYMEARKKAAESDAFIRDYLGRSGE